MTSMPAHIPFDLAPAAALVAFALVVGTTTILPAHEVADEGTAARLAYDHALPTVPGKSIRGVLVEYEPGGASAPHIHPPSAFIAATVLEGAVVSRVNDGPEVVYRAGQSFFEKPGDRHTVSRNASRTAPARLLAVFVLDTNETDLVTPAHAQ